MTPLFKIGFLGTFLLAIYYLVALYYYMPNDSVTHSKVAMEEACSIYLWGQLFISIAFFVFVIIGNPQVLTGVTHKGKETFQDDIILDEEERLNISSVDRLERQDIQFLRGLNFVNIAPNITLLFLLCLWVDDTLIIVLTIPWAIIQGLIGFISMFVKEDTYVE